MPGLAFPNDISAGREDLRLQRKQQFVPQRRRAVLEERHVFEQLSRQVQQDLQPQRRGQIAKELSGGDGTKDPG